MKASRLSRRDFMRLTSTVTGGLLLAACTPTGPAATGDGSGATAENVELAFAMYNFDPWLVALDDMYKVFMTDNPGITVKVAVVAEQSHPDRHGHGGFSSRHPTVTVTVTIMIMSLSLRVRQHRQIQAHMYVCGFI